MVDRIRWCKSEKKVDWTGIYGYSKDAKTKDNPKGFAFEIVWEGSNKVLRIFTDGKYRYINKKQTIKLIKTLQKALSKEKISQ